MKVDPIYYFIQRLERLISQGNISQARNECTLFLSAIDILTFMSLSADSITYLKSSPYGYSAASTLSVLRILICSDDAPLEVRSGIITPSNITSRTTYDVLMPLLQMGLAVRIQMFVILNLPPVQHLGKLLSALCTDQPVTDAWRLSNKSSRERCYHRSLTRHQAGKMENVVLFNFEPATKYTFKNVLDRIFSLTAHCGFTGMI